MALLVDENKIAAYTRRRVVRTKPDPGSIPGASTIKKKDSSLHGEESFFFLARRLRFTVVKVVGYPSLHNGEIFPQHPFVVLSPTLFRREIR